MSTSRTRLGAAVMLLGALFAAPAHAEEETVGIPVTVRVTDTAGAPIATAVVRHPQEADRHRVNTETGSAIIDVLYLPNGDEIIVTKGMELEFEVSAPGYQNARVLYVVRKRKNVVPVVLEQMSLDMGQDEDLEDPVIQFGRDKPIE